MTEPAKITKESFKSLLLMVSGQRFETIRQYEASLTAALIYDSNPAELIEIILEGLAPVPDTIDTFVDIMYNTDDEHLEEHLSEYIQDLKEFVDTWG